ncbi:MAG: conserved phage C-terminal domain-containing protein [Sarcina sp.]
MIAPLDLNAKELEVYKLLYKKMDFDTFEVKYTLDQIAQDSDKILELTKRKVDVIIKKFIELNYLNIVQKGVKGKPTIYKITKINELMCNEYVTNKEQICNEFRTNNEQINVDNTKVEVIKGTNNEQIMNECVTNNEQICDEYVTPIKDKDKENIYSLIIEKLNEEAGTKFRSSGKKTKDLINARLNDKFILEDFYIVIENKVSEWKGTTFEKYLRPETLFGNKFEGYLNQSNNKKTTTVKEEKKEVKYNPDSEFKNLSLKELKSRFGKA